MPEQAIILTMARHIAKREVKRNGSANVSSSPTSKRGSLTRAADTYLDAHRAELMEKATETVRNDPQLRTLAQRYERTRKGNRQ